MSELADAIAAARAAEQHSFHMPGHRHGAGAGADALGMLGGAAFAHDVSELSGFDYLHAPGPALNAAQARAAAAFGADRTWFLVNGATVGNLAAVAAVAGPGRALVMARASHRSVYSAVAVTGAGAAYLPPTFTADGSLWLAPAASDARQLLASTPDVAAVHITSPSYYGVCADVAAFAGLAHEHGMPLIVDEAHGAHFAFHPSLPPTALSQGADVVIQSPHKTLTSLTQSSLLHVRGGRVDGARLTMWLGMLQSSSPSALLQASLDLSVAAMVRHGEARWSEVLRLVARLRTGLGSWAIELPGVVTDPTKVLIETPSRSGYAVAAALAEVGIRPEFADPRRIVCSVGLGHTDADVDALVRAIQRFGAATARPSSAFAPRWPAVNPVVAVPLSAALQAPTEVVPMTEVAGRATAEYVIPYPPGVPLVVPGEVLDAQAVALLGAVRATGGRIVGPADPTGATLRVLRSASA